MIVIRTLYCDRRWHLKKAESDARICHVSQEYEDNYPYVSVTGGVKTSLKSPRETLTYISSPAPNCLTVEEQIHS